MSTGLILLALLSVAPVVAPLQTVAEESNFERTGRYAEVESLCRAFPLRFGKRVRCETFGTTPEGRPMLALVAGTPDALTPAGARRKHRPVVLVQGGIHAGEIEGKDGGFIALRELLKSKEPGNPLERVTFVFVPVFNVDGHERFEADQRPQQRGPVEMGWRATAQNLNLNRDYTKLETPEMVAMVGLLDAWDPVLYADLHATDGAQFEQDVGLVFEPRLAGPELLRPETEKMTKATVAGLEALGHLPVPFYPAFKVHTDLTSGFEYIVSSPRFSQSYWASRGRFGVLVETHSWRPYGYRVKTMQHVVEQVLSHVAAHGAELQKAIAANDARQVASSAREAVLAWKSDGKTKPVDFKGYAYRKEPSPLWGEAHYVYDEKKPQVWKSKYADSLIPDVKVSLPAAGYVVPAAHAAWVARKLAVHGIRFTTLKDPRTKLAAEAYRATRTHFVERSFEGRQRLETEGSWGPVTVDVRPGSLFVPLQQPGSELIAHLMEPAGVDSFMSWGFFNAHFEPREYIEEYVLGPWAKALLAKDPKVRAAWDAKLKDPAFALDREARFNWFFEKHPSYDHRMGVYPVLRTATPL